jgi:DNA-binding NarL/FixJ family response regulator
MHVNELWDKEYKVLIADDHTLFRQAVAKILKNMAGIKKVGEAANGLEVLKKIAAEKWDLILLDIEMPKMDGLTTLVNLKNQEAPPVIIVSMHEDDAHVNRAYNFGALGYLHKDCETEELKTAVMSVLQGNPYFSRKVKDIVMKTIVKRDVLKEGAPKLTKKEIQVLKLICEQKTGKEISLELNVAEQTVNSYRINLLRKTRSINMAGLVLYAIDHGLYRS